MNNEDTLLILVHDAWHGAWEWEGVINRLNERGWTAIAPDLPAHGALYQKQNSVSGLTIESYATALVEFVRAQPAPNIVLVAQGTAGPVCQRASELLYEKPANAKLIGIVFMGAFILRDGEAIADAFPPEMAEVFKQLGENRSDNCIYMEDLVDFWRFNIMSDDMRKADAVLSRLNPEPVAPLFEKVNLKSFYENRLPYAYLSYNEDNLLPLGSFYPQLANKLGQYKHASVNTGHEGPITKPREVAESLIYLIISAFSSPTK